MGVPKISQNSATSVRSRSLAATIALILLLVVALALRLHSVAFGLPALNDPDELTFELGAVRMLSGPTLDPGWFGHPATTTMYVLALITIAVFSIGYLSGQFSSIKAFADAIYADPSWVMLPGRVAMVLFAVGTIYLTYRLARDLFGPRVALAAAALAAVNPVHITWSQIIRSDMMACFFMLLCMGAALRILREDRWRDYVLAALWLALATTTKWPFSISALAVFAAIVGRALHHPADRARALRRLALFALMSLGLAAVISPYAILSYETVLGNLRGEAQLHHIGATGGSPWENAWWYLQGPIFSGFGAAGLLLIAAGIPQFARHREALTIIAPVLLGFAVAVCLQKIVWERWGLPFMPLLAIVAALGLDGLRKLLARSLTPRLANLAVAVALAATLTPLALRAEADTRMRLNDTRQLASEWARAYVPTGSTVLIEHFAFDLVSEPWRFLFPLGDAGCVDAKAMLQGKVQLSTVEAGRGSRSNIDYGTLAPAQRDTCRSDYAILTQYDRYLAERSDYPDEHAAYEALLTQGQIVATFAPKPDEIGGPIVRIVRFQR